MTDGRRDREADQSNAGDLFDAHPDPAVYFTHEGETLPVTAVNPAFEGTFGRSAETAIGALREALTTPETVDDLAARLLRGSTVDATVTCDTVTGERAFRVRARWLSAERRRGFLLYTAVDPSGIGTRDRDGDADRVEELAHVVSHELRNPLDSVRTRVETARETGEVEHLDTALRNVDRMSSIITDLTTLAREGRLVESREPLDLDATVAAAWETVDAADATLTTPGELGRVRADDSALEHLLENLFRNAVEHGSTSPGPPAPGDAGEHASTGSRSRAGDPGERPDRGVTVTVGRLDTGDGSEEHAVGGFYVADDGPGIPEDERDRIFEAGYTTDRDGTGLGLRIVERVAQAHGWTVSITDSESGGARFEVRGVDTA